MQTEYEKALAALPRGVLVRKLSKVTNTST